MNVQSNQKGSILQLNVELPRYKYLNTVIGRDCFEEIHWLLKTFGKSASAAKEITESYSAIANLDKTFRRIQESGKKPLVIHVGDGSRFLTGAMTTLNTKSFNLSIDPNARVDIFTKWQEKFRIRDLKVVNKVWQEADQDILDYLDEIRDTAGYSPEIIVTCVHGHVDLREFLKSLPWWRICYSLACCCPKNQIPDMHNVIESGEDMNVLSPERKYKIYTNA